MASNDDSKIVYNILLIGETGVGKSTFINAFANYINFPNFDAAKNAEDINILIPTRFTILDDEFNERIVKVGEDENESDKAGQSATQFCKLYAFRSNDADVVIRIIDSPGVGDTRGVEQDEKNLAHMIDYIGQLQYINAIVIMLKPNDARATVLFDYCIKQLLASLERSAVDNIVFLFTNCRATFYKPGDTVQPLKAILNDISMKPPHVKIPFAKSNTFCFDNEAFRFLLASRDGCLFEEDSVKGFSESWETSATTAEKFLDYIASRKPHDIKNSVSLVKARTAIEKLKMPLADISNHIQKNIDKISRKEQLLSDHTKDVAELRKLLTVTRIDLRTIKLDFTMNVCTHRECTKIHNIEGTVHYEYLTECHYPCKVRGVSTLIRSDDRMRYCSGMNKKGKAEATCKTCGHHHLDHMHIDYKTEPHEVIVTNEKVKTDLAKKTIDQRDIEEALKEHRRERQKYEVEKDVLQQTIAKFAYYLKTSAIVSYNDAYEQYLRYLIEKEKKNDDSTALQMIENYKQLIRGHQEQKRLWDEQLARAEASGEQIVITGAEILASIEELFKLELTGQALKDMYDTVDTHVSAEVEEVVVQARGKGAKKYFKKAYTAVKGWVGY